MPEIIEHSHAECPSEDVTVVDFWWTVLWNDGTEERIPMSEMGMVMLHGPKYLPLEMRERFRKELEGVS